SSFSRVSGDSRLFASTLSRSVFTLLFSPVPTTLATRHAHHSLIHFSASLLYYFTSSLRHFFTTPSAPYTHLDRCPSKPRLNFASPISPHLPSSSNPLAF